MSASPFVLPPPPARLRIETERLRLRPLVEGDLPGMVVYRGDPDVCRFLPFESQTADDIRARIGHVFGGTTLAGERGGVVVAVERRDDDLLIGDLVLFHLDVDAGTAEIGWVIRPDASGRGYATEAVRAFIDAAFQIYGLRRVVARIDPENTASLALADRVGMRREAHLVEASWFKGRWADEVQFAVLAHEWRSAPDGGSASR